MGEGWGVGGRATERGTPPRCAIRYQAFGNASETYKRKMGRDVVKVVCVCVCVLARGRDTGEMGGDLNSDFKRNKFAQPSTERRAEAFPSTQLHLPRASVREWQVMGDMAEMD